MMIVCVCGGGHVCSDHLETEANVSCLITHSGSPVYSEIPSVYFHPLCIFYFPVDPWHVQCLLVADLQGMAFVPLRMSWWSKWKTPALSGSFAARDQTPNVHVFKSVVDVYNLPGILRYMGICRLESVSSFLWVSQEGGKREQWVIMGAGWFGCLISTLCSSW